MNANLLRRVNWLWKHRHTHDDDNFQSQITLIKTTVESQDDRIGNPHGQSIHVTATESIPDDTATEITFDTVVSQTTVGFDGTRTSMPTSTLTAPFAAVSQATVRVTWDDVAEGGWLGDGVTATLKLNGTTVDEWVADDPALFPIAPLQADSVKLPVERDDELTLELHQASGTARDVTVEVSWGLEDKLVGALETPPTTVLVQARVWEDGTTEPDTWDVEGTTALVSGDLHPALIFGDAEDDGDRHCDWVGWDPAGSSAPVLGEAGTFMDFDEAAHTLGSTPDGWTHITGTDRLTVQALASSNTSGGQAAVSDNWSSPDNERGTVLWTDATAGSTSDTMEVTAALQAGVSNRNMMALAILNTSDEGWQVQPQNTGDTVRLAHRNVGELDDADMTLKANTWYRVRLRVTPGG